MYVCIFAVRVVGNSAADMFEGILLQGRVVADDSPTGSFEDPPDGSQIALSQCTPSDVRK